MDDPGEIERFHDRCSDLMRELLDALAAAPDRPRAFPEIEDALAWPRRRIASALGGLAPAHHRVPWPAALSLAGRPQSRSGRWEMWMDRSVEEFRTDVTKIRNYLDRLVMPTLLWMRAEVAARRRVPGVRWSG